MAGQRPFGVSLLVIIIVIYGISAIVTGVLGLLSVFGNAGTGVFILSALVLLIGLIYLLVAKGLWNGSRGARLLVTLFTLLALITGVLLIFGDGTLWSGIIQTLISLIVLGLLFSARAKEFFA